MNFLNVVIFFSAFSFLFYGIAYFVSTNMKNEFKRFGLEKFGTLTAVLELTGALGLFIGFAMGLGYEQASVARRACSLHEKSMNR